MAASHSATKALIRNPNRREGDLRLDYSLLRAPEKRLATHLPSTTVQQHRRAFSVRLVVMEFRSHPNRDRRLKSGNVIRIRILKK